MNPGIPPDNPLRPPFAAPSYLPPTTKKPVIARNNSTFIRFGDYDDMPIWSVAPDEQTAPPPSWGRTPVTQRPQVKPIKCLIKFN